MPIYYPRTSGLVVINVIFLVANLYLLWLPTTPSSSWTQYLHSNEDNQPKVERFEEPLDEGMDIATSNVICYWLEYDSIVV